MDNITVEFTQDFNMPYNLAVLINDLMREQAYQVKKCATASILYIIEKQLLNNSKLFSLRVLLCPFLSLGFSVSCDSVCQSVKSTKIAYFCEFFVKRSNRTTNYSEFVELGQRK